MRRALRFAAPAILVAGGLWLLVANRCDRRAVSRSSVSNGAVRPQARTSLAVETDTSANSQDVALPWSKRRASSFIKGGGKISRPVVDAFLKQRGRTPQTLLIGWRASGIDDYLEAAIAEFPNAPEVAVAVLNTELPVESRASWVQRFKQNAPGNPLANFYAAIERLRENDGAGAAREIAEAAGKPPVDDYFNAGVQEREALFRAAGSTPSRGAQ